MPAESNPPPTVDTLLRVVAERDAEVAQLRLLVDKLKAQLLRRAREQFGASSEQLAAQLTLIGTEAADAPLAPVVPLQPRAPRKPRSNDRKLPVHLPRETRVHYPEGLAAGACECGECGGKLRTLDEDVSEQLEHVPASFKVIRHVRPKLACVRCQRIFQADAPSRSIQRGLPGPGLLAQVLVAKYCDHTPLYRLQPHLRTRRRGYRSLDDGGLGGPKRCAARPAGGCAGPLRAERSQAAQRRHAGQGARPRAGQDQDGAIVGLCAR